MATATVATVDTTEESALLMPRPLPSQRLMLMLRLNPTTMADMDSHTMAVTDTGPTAMLHTLMAVTTEESVPLMPSPDTDTTVRLMFNDRSICCCHNHSIRDCGQTGLSI